MLQGFFSREEITSPVKQRGMSCITCGLYKNAQSPKIKPYGDFQKEIMVIGEFPDEDDDAHGKPWQGEAGTYLRRAYRRLGVDLFEDCVNLNAVNCNTPNDRDPTGHEVLCCQTVRVLPAIREFQPKVIILHGYYAVQSVIGLRWGNKLGMMGRWAGWTIPDRFYGAWVCPTYHPLYVMRQEDRNKTELGVLWKQHLERAFSLVDKPFPKDVNENQVTLVDTPGEVLSLLLKEKPEYLAFDIETTGLKPYNKEAHKVICIALSDRPDRSFVIPGPTKKQDIQQLRKLLTDPQIKKIAANMKFEHTWMSLIYGIEVDPWHFDTMLAAHVLDNRTEISGLKFQSYVRFGIVGYDDEVSSYLNSPDAYSVNRVEELVSFGGYHKLATYCGMDAILTYRLAEQQKGELMF